MFGALRREDGLHLLLEVLEIQRRTWSGRLLHQQRCDWNQSKNWHTCTLRGIALVLDCGVIVSNAGKMSFVLTFPTCPTNDSQQDFSKNTAIPPFFSKGADMRRTIFAAVLLL